MSSDEIFFSTTQLWQPLWKLFHSDRPLVLDAKMFGLKSRISENISVSGHRWWAKKLKMLRITYLYVKICQI